MRKIKTDEEKRVRPDAAAVAEALRVCQEIQSHYAKKEGLLMPLLYAYGVTSPSQVMWDEDDEIQKELGALTRAVQGAAEAAAACKERIAALAQRVAAMIQKEERILFPLCLRFYFPKRILCTKS